MSLALLGVVAAALCSGAATVLQALAVTLEPPAGGREPTLLVRLGRRPAYGLALLLVVPGFALSFLALRTLPLFVVQSGRAPSLAVTAVLSVVALRARLSLLETAAVLGVVAGLVLLAASAAAERSDLARTRPGSASSSALLRWRRWPAPCPAPRRRPGLTPACCRVSRSLPSPCAHGPCAT